jgi:hypothetical protein
MGGVVTWIVNHESHEEMIDQVELVSDEQIRIEVVGQSDVLRFVLVKIELSDVVNAPSLVDAALVVVVPPAFEDSLGAEVSDLGSLNRHRLYVRSLIGNRSRHTRAHSM